MAKTYPKAFPTPLIEGYGITVDMGVARTQMSTGRYRQRRKYRTMPHEFTLNFAVAIHELDQWQMWVNEFAYEYFEMPLTSYLSGIDGEDGCSPHIVRFISDLKLSPITDKVMRVSVMAELAPLDVADQPVKFTDDWIVAGTPCKPSTGDVFIAGAPCTPSTGQVKAGTPCFPAAVV